MQIPSILANALKATSKPPCHQGQGGSECAEVYASSSSRAFVRRSFSLASSNFARSFAIILRLRLRKVAGVVQLLVQLRHVFLKRLLLLVQAGAFGIEIHQTGKDDVHLAARDQRNAGFGGFLRIRRNEARRQVRHVHDQFALLLQKRRIGRIHLHGDFHGLLRRDAVACADGADVRNDINHERDGPFRIGIDVLLQRIGVGPRGDDQRVRLVQAGQLLVDLPP